MENINDIPDDIKRFILRSIESVPHLEATLLFYHEPKLEWSAGMIAQSLYINEKRAAAILVDLCNSGFIGSKGDVYQYQPHSLELESVIIRLDQVYSKHLIQVTNLIHSKVSKQAQIFGDAFKWQNEKEQ